MTFQRIDKSRRFLQVSRQLRQSIFNGDYRPGQRLPNERALSETFGVSRIIVREAVWDLKRSGLVEIKRGAHGGAFVQKMKHQAVTSVMRDVLSMTHARPSHIVEVRLFLEPAVAALAAQKATEQDLAEMHDFLQTVPTVQTDEYVRWNIDFHRLVAKASQNPIFELQVNILLDFAEDMILSLKPNDRILHDTTAHPAILKKLSERDAEATRSLFYAHLLEIKPSFDDWEKYFDTDGLIRSKIQ